MKLSTTIWAYYSEYSKEWNYTTTDSNMSTEWVKVEDYEIEFDELPLVQLNQSQVDIYQAQKKKLMADHQVACNKLEHKIQDLLCIENKSSQDDIPF